MVNWQTKSLVFLKSHLEISSCLLTLWEAWFKWLYQLILPSIEQRKRSMFFCLRVTPPCSFNFYSHFGNFKDQAVTGGQSSYKGHQCWTGEPVLSSSNLDPIYWILRNYILKDFWIYESYFLLILILLPSQPSFWPKLTMGSHWESKWSKGGKIFLSWTLLTGNVCRVPWIPSWKCLLLVFFGNQGLFYNCDPVIVRPLISTEHDLAES